VGGSSIPCCRKYFPALARICNPCPYNLPGRVLLNNAVINRKLIGIRQKTKEEWLVYYLNSGNCKGTDYKSAPAGGTFFAAQQ